MKYVAVDDYGIHWEIGHDKVKKNHGLLEEFKKHPHLLRPVSKRGAYIITTDSQGRKQKVLRGFNNKSRALDYVAQTRAFIPAAARRGLQVIENHSEAVI